MMNIGKHNIEPIKIESGVPQYFLDDSLVAHSEKLVRRWLPAKTLPRPVIEPDRPWESRILALYGTVLQQEDGSYRLYYTEWAGHEVFSKMFLATSKDGFRWSKPDLGIVEFEGSRANNIVLAPGLYNDGPSLIFDAQDSEYPYKMLNFMTENVTETWGKSWGLYGYKSADGLHWEKLGDGLLLRAGDRTNVMSTKPGGKFVAYTRHPEMIKQMGVRSIYRTESEDFVNWSEPELVLAPDLSDEPDVEFYGLSAFERNGWYFGLLEYWRSSTDTIEVHLVFSRDGKNWRRPAHRAPFIAAAYDWNRKWNSCASNGPIIVNEQMVFYFGGRWVSHHYDSAQQYGSIGYASLPLDRFCALEGDAGGMFVTQPIIWPGGEIVLNADARESFDSHPGVCNGEIAVEVLNADGSAIPNYSGDNRGIFRWNTHMRCGIHPGDVKWPNEAKMETLKGKPIRLRFHLRHARLFTFTAIQKENNNWKGSL